MTTTTNPLDVSNRVFTILIIALIGLVSFWSFRIYEIYKTTSGNLPREISVEGFGKAYITPDIAKITFGVSTQGKKSEEIVAENENTKKINAIMTVLKEIGIPKEDIRTIDPGYQYNVMGQEVVSDEYGYILDHTIEVTVRDFAKNAEVVSKTVAAGGKMRGDVNFTVEDKNAGKTEARNKAIADAKAKAEQVAEQTGIKIGKAVSFYEYDTTGEYYGKGFNETGIDSSILGTVEPGREEISLTVTLGYQIH